jgi:hypothetical protein
MRAWGTRVAGMVALPLIVGLVAGVGSASALTLGVGWSGDPGLNEPEMLQVGKSGASTFRCHWRLRTTTMAS